MLLSSSIFLYLGSTRVALHDSQPKIILICPIMGLVNSRSSRPDLFSEKSIINNGSQCDHTEPETV